MVNAAIMLGNKPLMISFSLVKIRDLLHKYANEDVSLGSWFIGLNVEHVDDKRLCCSTSPQGKELNNPGLVWFHLFYKFYRFYFKLIYKFKEERLLKENNKRKYTKMSLNFFNHILNCFLELSLLLHDKIVH